MPCTCRRCPNPVPEGFLFCEPCEQEALDKNIERFKSNTSLDFSEADRVEAMVMMEDRRIVAHRN